MAVTILTGELRCKIPYILHKNIFQLSDGVLAIIDFLLVESMSTIGRVLEAIGVGTQVSIRSATINANLLSNVWRGITSLDSANVVIENLAMTRNENLEHHIAAAFQGTISIFAFTAAASTGSLITVSPFSPTD